MGKVAQTVVMAAIITVSLMNPAIGLTLWQAAAVATAIVGFQTYQQARARKAAKDAYNAGLQDRLLMQALVDGARSWLYGRVRNVDGVIFKVAHGANSEIFTLLVPIAGHAIDAFETVYFDDLPVQLDSDGYVLTAPYDRVVPTNATESVAFGGGAFSFTLQHLPLNASAFFFYSSTTADGGAGGGIVIPLTISGSVVAGVVDLSSLSDYTPGSGGVTVQYQWDDGGQKARVRKYLGGPGQSPLADLKSDLEADGIHMLGDTDRFEGIALLRIDLTYDPDAYPNGVPSVSAVVRGAKVLDTRTGVVGWSDNPALCARDWALCAHGGGLSADVIDEPSFVAAANACDVSTNFSLPSATVTDSLYRCGTVIKTDSNPWDAFNELVESMAGKAGWPGGKLRVRAGVYSAPVATITDDWLSGKSPIQIVPEPPMDEAINVFQATIANAHPSTAGDATGYVTSASYPVGATEITLSSGTGTVPAGEYVSFGADPTYYPLENGVTAAGEHLTLAAPGLTGVVPSGATVNLLGDLKTAYVGTPLPDVRAEAYIELDGRELATQNTFSAVTDSWHAQHIAGVLMRDARNGLTATLPCNMRAFPLQMFDVVNVLLSRPGWDNKTFEVLGWQFGMSGGVILNIKETVASIYQVDAGFSAIDQTPNSNLPNPFKVPMITGLSASSGTAQLLVQGDGTLLTRVLVSWDPITDEAVRQSTRKGIVLRWWLASQDESTAAVMVVDGDQTSAYLTGVVDGEFYMISAQAQNSLVRGPECPPILHLVLGKTEPPPDVSAFAVFENDNGTRQYFWSYPIPPVDLRGFTVRYAPSIDERPWSEMMPLFDAGALERTRESADPPDGEYTISIKAVDTSGNESTNAFSINVLLDGKTVGNASYMRRPHDFDWPGIKDDCYVLGYILDALSVETWDSPEVTWDTAGTWRGTSRTPITYQDEVIDLGTVTTGRLRCAALGSSQPLAQFMSSTDGTTWSDWGPVPSDSVTVRYMVVRWIVSGQDPQLLRAQTAVYV